jgi:predicted RNA-binding Zn-ribbon protein involved in translation (DUF1610 family)
MANFSFSCVSCGNATFTLDASSIGIGAATPVATFVCPQCGEYNAVQERAGGGLVVAADQHAKSSAGTHPSGG